MVADRWKRPDGSKWNSDLKVRVARRFRQHVRTKRNPGGRIHKESCCRCGAKHGEIGETGPIQVDGNHVDYDEPFLVAWLCQLCHRAWEKRSFRLRRRDLFNYASVVITYPERWREGSGVPF